MRVVLDTNVLASSYIFPGGNPGRIRQGWERGDFEVAASELILAEYRRALRYPRVARRHKMTAEQIEQVLSDLLDLGSYEGILILTPASFVQLLAMPPD